MQLSPLNTILELPDEKCHVVVVVGGSVFFFFFFKIQDYFKDRNIYMTTKKFPERFPNLKPLTLLLLCCVCVWVGGGGGGGVCRE